MDKFLLEKLEIIIKEIKEENEIRKENMTKWDKFFFKTKNELETLRNKSYYAYEDLQEKIRKFKEANELLDKNLFDLEEISKKMEEYKSRLDEIENYHDEAREISETVKKFKLTSLQIDEIRESMDLEKNKLEALISQISFISEKVDEIISKKEKLLEMVSNLSTLEEKVVAIEEKIDDFEKHVEKTTEDIISRNMNKIILEKYSDLILEYLLPHFIGKLESDIVNILNRNVVIEYQSYGAASSKKEALIKSRKQ